MLKKKRCNPARLQRLLLGADLCVRRYGIAASMRAIVSRLVFPRKSYELPIPPDVLTVTRKPGRY
jgi:hypothetical protein